MSAFDTARDLRMPGVVIDRVYIDPKLLSTRMRTAIKTMLRAGHAPGSWSSKSKSLAVKLAERFDLLLIRSHSHGGWCVPGRHRYSDSTAKRVEQVIDASETVGLIAARQQHSGDYLELYLKRIRELHAEARRLVHSGHPTYRWATMTSVGFVEQAAQIFAEGRSAAEREAVEKVCDMLDNGTHIEIKVAI